MRTTIFGRIRSDKKYYKLTETRLYQFELVKDSLKRGLQELLIEDDKSKVDELLIRIRKSDAEIKRIENALNYLKDDDYYSVIELKYRDFKSDEEVAEILYCDPATIRRNKKRLVNQIAILLYGADAMIEQETLKE